MGIELTNMDMEDLDNILLEVAKGNTGDMSTFRELLLDMFGGLNVRQYQKLESYIHNELGLYSDADLYHMGPEQRRKILEYLQ